MKKDENYIKKCFLKDFIKILNNNPDEVIIFALNYIENRYLEGIGFKNSPSMRRLLFFRAFLSNKGNATKAAIEAGYSPKSAKQQGYRTLKWIQRQNTQF
jgi:hypothetical protein